MSEQPYEASTLANLSKAFEATWEVLQVESAPDNLEAQNELRQAVSGKILERAANGVTDPQELRNQVLKSLDQTVPAAPKKTLVERLWYRNWH